jgi:hypothetical protein
MALTITERWLISVPIGIKLRGSDKQSSIWHHKEKE